jgi:hypothetical protein
LIDVWNRQLDNAVDATGLVRVQATPGARVVGERFQCLGSNASSPYLYLTLADGRVVMQRVLCPNDAPPPPGAQARLYVHASGQQWLGVYALHSSPVQPSHPEGRVLVFARAGAGQAWQQAAGLLQVVQGAHLVQVTPDARLTLTRLGYLSGCATLSVTLGAAGAFNFSVPVLQPTPSRLLVSLSRSTVVVSTDASGLLPSQADVTAVRLGTSDLQNTSVDADPRLAFSDDPYGLARFNQSTVHAQNASGTASVGAYFEGYWCLRGSAALRIAPEAVVGSTILCRGRCPRFLTLPDDPLHALNATLFPAALDLSELSLRLVLADGTELRVARPEWTVRGQGALDDADPTLVRPLGEEAGTISVEYPGAAPHTVRVHARVATSAGLTCGGGDCEAVAFTLPGDGAALPPFHYSDRVDLQVVLRLVDDTAYVLDEAPGDPILTVRNELSRAASYLRASEVRWAAGENLVALDWPPAWRLAPNRSVVLLHVVRELKFTYLHSPLRQLHCSGIWEEGACAVSAACTDGTEAPVNATLEAVFPLELHAPLRYHALAEGVGTLTARFGRTTQAVSVSAVRSSVLIQRATPQLVTDWTGEPGSTRALVAALDPDPPNPWTDPARPLASRVLTWSSDRNASLAVQDAAAQGSVHVNAAQGSVQVNNTAALLVLLADSPVPVGVTATLAPCEDQPAIGFAATVRPNLQPTSPGELDLGQESGLAVPPCALGQTLALPLFVWAPVVPLQGFTAELDYPPSVLSAVDCESGALGGHCILADAGRYRLVGANASWGSVGRVRVATVTLACSRPAVAQLVLACVEATFTNHSVRRAEVEQLYAVQIEQGTNIVTPQVTQTGTNTTQAGTNIVSPATTQAPTEPSVWGDVDGDGWFTSADVLFAQEYVALGPLAASVPTCVAARCLWSWELGPWQRRMLHPVEDPNKVAPGPPTAEDPDFLLRALAGKLWFLSDWGVLASESQLRVTATFRDYAGRPAPTERTLVTVELCTSHNRGLTFTTVARWTASTSC